MHLMRVHWVVGERVPGAGDAGVQSPRGAGLIIDAVAGVAFSSGIFMISF